MKILKTLGYLLNLRFALALTMPLCSMLQLQGQETGLTVKGEILSIKNNDTLFINGSLRVGQASSDGIVIDGDIVNSGKIYIKDSISSYNPKVFYKSSNPFLFNKENSTYIEQSSAGDVIFCGNSKPQIITSSAPNQILFNNIIIKNPFGITLENDIITLGSIYLEDGGLNLNGSNLYLFYDKNTNEKKYDGRINLETKTNHVWDTVLIEDDSLGFRSGYIVEKNLDREGYNNSNIGINYTGNGWVYWNSILRGHTTLPYAGDGSIRKFFSYRDTSVLVENHLNNFTISYLDGADYEKLNINEPDFRLFRKSTKSAVTYEPIESTLNAENNYVEGGLITKKDSTYVITIADINCSDPPQAKELVNFSVCAGSPFEIKAEVIIPGSQSTYCKWSKDNIPDYSNQQVFKDTLHTPDTVNYALKLYDNRGCFSLDTVTVTCYPIPQPEIITTKINYCFGESVELEDSFTFTGKDSSRTWSLGDGTNSNLEKNITHIYSEPGSYEIQLVSSANGCSSTATKTINIHALPSVNFTAENICGDLLYAIVHNTTIASGQSISNVKWNFGDGFETEVLDPLQHEYTSYGNKTISLWVKTNFGCESTYSSNININSHTIGFSAENVCLGSETKFNNQSTINNKSATTSAVAHTFTWDFGDGTTSTDANPTHVYTSADTYEVSLYMHIDNCTDTLTKEVTVFETPDASFAIENVCVGSNVTLAPTHSGYDAYSWVVEGNPIIGDSPKYTFDQAGNIAVSLTATNKLGCKATSTQTIKVYPNPVANFNIQNSCEGNPTMFYNQSTISGANLSYQWTFNEVNSSTEINPKFIFTSSSANTATLIATSDKGCSNTITKPVEVYPIPRIGLTSGITAFCGSSAEVDATDKNLPGCRYTWSDGVKTPSRTFINEGVYSVTATSSHGCESSKEIEVKLNTAMDPIIPTSISYCGSGKLSTNYSSSWCTWKKPNGEIVTGLSEIDADESGVYKITVSGGGCTATDNVSVTIKPLPTVTLGADLSICEGTNATLDAGADFSTYKWFTGETTRFINANKSGKYSVVVTNSFGCTNSDTIAIRVNPVPRKPFTVNEIAKCLHADLSAGYGAISYLWSTGESTNNIRVNSSGDYWVKVSNAECSTYDTVSVTINQVDALNLGPDISVCEGNQAVINAGDHGSSYSYIWNRQLSTSNYYTTSKAGRYICQIVNNENGCASTDTIQIHLNPKPRINLGADKSLCNSASYEFNAGDEGSMMQWGSSNGFVSIQQKVNITEAGKYWVTVMNEFGCVSSDTIQIYPSSGNVDAMFIAASKIYEGDTVVFKNMSYPMPYNSEWNFGDGIKSILENPEHIYYYPHTFNATLTVTNGYCTSSITKPITVIKRPKGTDYGDSKKRDKYVEIISSKLYPNPTSGNLTFEMEINDFNEVVVAIYSLTGRLVTMEKFNKSLFLNKQYNLNNLTPGIYILKAWVGKESVAYKIIKTN